MGRVRESDGTNRTARDAGRHASRKERSRKARSEEARTSDQSGGRLARQLIRLHDLGGNRAVQRVVNDQRRGDDHRTAGQNRSERDADRTAAAVMRPGGTDRKGSESGSAPQPPSAVAAVRSDTNAPGDPTTRGDGRPLSNTDRAFFERRFDQPLPRVRVHDGSEAAAMADAVDARAFTFGRDIYFGEGQYRPETTRGRALLAHELTHVFQQSAGPKQIQRQSTSDPVPIYSFYESADVRGLSDEELEAEIHSIREWLADHPVGSAESEQARQTLLALEHEAARRIPEMRPQPVEPTRPDEEDSGVIVGALLGEFESDPSVGAILLDTGLGLIPIVDQVLDVRDIVAHIYWMAEKGEYDRAMRWFGLVVSLVGAIPEIGSLIKGALKIVLKGAGAVVSNLGDLLDFGRRFLPEALSSLAGFRRSLLENWGRFVARGTEIWNTAMTFLRRRMDQLSLLVSDRLRAAIDRIAVLGRERIPESFRRLIQQVDEIMAAALERLGIRPAEFGGLQPAMAGAGSPGARAAPSVPSGAEPMQMSSLSSGGGGSRSGYTSEEIAEVRGAEISRGDPGAIAEARRAEDMPLTLTQQQFIQRFRSTLERVERHHSFFRYLLRAISKSRGVRGIPRHGRLTRLPEAQHRAIHDLFDLAHPELARRLGASDEIAAAIQRGEITPAEIADLLVEFYRDVSRRSPDLLPPEALEQMERVIASIRRRGNI